MSSRFKGNGSLGTALAFPPRPDGMGGMALVSGPAAVDDSIRAIITSLLRSHQFEPWLGIPSFIFQPIPDTDLWGALIQEAIVNGDDRVDPTTIQATSKVGGDSGYLQIELKYMIKGTADQRTLEQGFRSIPA